MKNVYWLVNALALAAAGCAAPRAEFGATAHGGGAVVPVWVTDGYLSVGEEPIRRLANSSAAIVFKLDNETETNKYMFAGAAVTLDKPGEFSCSTTSDKVVTCTRTGRAADKFKYTISVTPRATSSPAVDPLDPFIITH